MNAEFFVTTGPGWRRTLMQLEGLGHAIVPHVGGAPKLGAMALREVQRLWQALADL